MNLLEESVEALDMRGDRRKPKNEPCQSSDSSTEDRSRQHVGPVMNPNVDTGDAHPDRHADEHPAHLSPRKEHRGGHEGEESGQARREGSVGSVREEWRESMYDEWSSDEDNVKMILQTKAVTKKANPTDRMQRSPFGLNQTASSPATVSKAPPKERAITRLVSHGAW